MHGAGFLRDLIVILGVSLLVVLILHRLRLPTITGFIVAGLLLGPHSLGLVSETARIEALADAGVVLLLFTVGMEFSLAGLRRLWGTALAGGVLPVAAAAALGGLAGAAGLGGLAVGPGVFLGFLVSISSTVIALKALADRGQIDSPHGRAATGVAVFQDLLVVPIMLLTPFLAPVAPGAAPRGVAELIADPSFALLQAALVIGVVLLVSMWAVPRLLAGLVALRSREVFLISVLTICLTTAWITSQLGLSIALGAFLAGLVISESEYGHQALADMLPFRDSLNSLFFVSIGMLLDPWFVAHLPLQVAASAAGIIVLKLLLIGGVLLLTGQSLTLALQAGLALSQVGEFSFVLLRFASGHRVLDDAQSQLFLTSAVLTMIVTPLLLAASPRLIEAASRWERRGWWKPAKDLRGSDEPLGHLDGHVVIVGYGFNGRNLSRVLREIEIPYVVLEMNPETVRRARTEEKEPILFGDATSPGILERLGAARARVMVLAISDPPSTRRAVSVAHQHFPALHIVVRTRYLTEVDELYRLGAQVVIPEEVETSMEIFSRVLEHYGVPREALVKHARRIRAERYGVFIKGRPAPLEDLSPYLSSAEVRLCALTPGAAAVGRSLRELDLRSATGATILALVRAGAPSPNPSPETRLREGDAVVLLGSPEQLGAAMEKLAGAG